jgi:hypothetical protein
VDTFEIVILREFQRLKDLAASDGFHRSEPDPSEYLRMTLLRKAMSSAKRPDP